MISEFFFNDQLKQQYSAEKYTDRISNLNRINVFIGPNNSGKSRFLRELFKNDNLNFEVYGFNFSKVLETLKIVQTDLQQLFKEAGIQEAENILSKTKHTVDKVKLFSKNSVNPNISLVKDIANFYSTKGPLTSWSSGKPGTRSLNGAQMALEINQLGKTLHGSIAIYDDEFDYQFEKIYLPTLRGLRPIQFNGSSKTDFIEIDSDNYKFRTIKDYFGDTNNKEDFIFTGLSLYKETKAMLLGDKHKRENIKAFENFLSEVFFENQTVTIIPHIDNDVVYIQIGEDDDRPIYNLGDGIQMIICLLYPLFFNRDKRLLVFIEEPETSLHPGLQRIFIETLLRDEFKEFQFFFTTHSNHFLDITLDLKDISIYTFKRIKEEKDYKTFIENTSNNDIKILELIGARNSAVFLSNCTIWVEGITDRLYLKKYLEIYQNDLFDNGAIEKKYKEDYHYSFVEYGGGNIVHWGFTNEDCDEKINATRISSKVFVVADRDKSDKPGTAKNVRLQQLKEKLDNHVAIVDGTEIENILSAEVLVKTLQKLEKEPLEYEKVDVQIEKYKQQKLGSFIESTFKNLKRKYAAQSGTVYCKLDFCKTAIEQIQTKEDLSEEAFNLSKKIYEFIKTANSF